MNRWHPALILAGNIVCGLWLAGGGLFYLLRFSMTFYVANKSAVDSVLGRFLGHP